MPLPPYCSTCSLTVWPVHAAERARRVADLKAQVKGGTYAVDNVEIAKALLSAV